jgi:hypothetical protein
MFRTSATPKMVQAILSSMPTWVSGRSTNFAE